MNICPASNLLLFMKSVTKLTLVTIVLFKIRIVSIYFLKVSALVSPTHVAGTLATDQLFSNRALDKKSNLENSAAQSGNSGNAVLFQRSHCVCFAKFSVVFLVFCDYNVFIHFLSYVKKC